MLQYPKASFDTSNGLVGLGYTPPPPPQVRPTLTGTKPNPFDPLSMNKGEQGWAAKSNQRYAGFIAENFGNGLVHVVNQVDNLTVEDITSKNFYRLVEVDKGQALTNSVVRRILATGIERSVARLRGTSHHVLFEDIDAFSDHYMGDPFAAIFDLQENVHDITYRRVKAGGAWGPKPPPGEYRNGDAFSSERGCKNIRFEDCEAYDCTDGGFDLKCTNMFGTNMKAWLNKRNFRGWGSGHVQNFVSEDPESIHLWFKGGAAYTFDNFVPRAKTPKAVVIEVEGTGATINIGHYDLSGLKPGTPLTTVDSGNKINWGPQGKPKTVNGLIP